MLLKREKPYKALPPEESIRKIRSILEETGFKFMEKQVNENPLFKASTLSLVNPDNGHLFFSTYGKGNSSRWASASAWGEMIERIQNLAFYIIFIYPTQHQDGNPVDIGFKYFPDEKVFSINNNPDDSFSRNYKDLTGIKTSAGELPHDIIGIPFYSLFDNKIEYFPFRILQVIAGSNGMCSGNTRDEALIQGISEIFERHVLKTLYLDPFCPPDIPLSCFEGTEIGNKIILLIGQYGFKVQIKDCSLGKGYPVIGALIRNNQNCYSFHLGADPSPITALERCFTEMFQGGNICFQSINELKENLPYNLKSAFWRINLSLTIKAYAGQWPDSIIQEKPAYEFKGFDHQESVSDQDDLQYLLKILKKENRKIFIRDNSFLGQPAYQIFIPGMSEITKIPDNLFLTAYLNFDKCLPIITNLRKSNRHDRVEMLKILNQYIVTSPGKQFNAIDYFRFNQTHPVTQLSSEQFMTLISLSILEGNVLDNFDLHEVRSNSFLNSIFKKDNFFKPSEIFSHLNIPDCFECSSCLIKSNCNLPYILSVWERIKEKMESYFCNNNISSIFEDVQT